MNGKIQLSIIPSEMLFLKKGYPVNSGSLDFTCNSHSAFNSLYRTEDILCEHMFSTALYSSSRLDEMDVLF